MSENKSKTKEYSNGEVTIVWKADLCIHSKNCVQGLPQAFDPGKRPWIDVEGAATEKLVDQVRKCPSGALTFYYNEESKPDTPPASGTERQVKVIPDGPLMVYGDVVVLDADGGESSRSKVTAFCRCGASANKPYCDGTHRKIDFKG